MAQHAPSVSKMTIYGPRLKSKNGISQRLKSKIDGRTFFWFSMAPKIKNNLLDLQNCEI